MVGSSTSGGTTTYSYDKLYRLKSATYPDGSVVSYSYDAMGNRLSLVDASGTTTYSYDAADRLLSAGATSFTWDPNGNQLSKGVQTFGYDRANRLVSANTSTHSVSYGYDGDGVRVRRSVDGLPTTYVQDLAASLPVVLVERTGGQDTSYLYGPDLIAQVLPDGSRRYYHTDPLGSVRAITDEAGQVVATYSYDAFGAVRTQTGGSDNLFTFAGEQSDPEEGLVFLRARYYDPLTGRFISKDPRAGFNEDVQSLNRYAYAGSSPTNLTDPSGQLASFVVGAIVGGIAGAGGYTAHALITGEQFKLEKLLVAGAGGAVVGAAIPLVAFGLASGAIELGSMSALGVTGGTALAGMEISGMAAVLKYEANQMVDERPVSWKRAALEFALEAPFGAAQGLGWANRSAGSVSNRLFSGLLTDIFKRSLKDLFFPNPVLAPGRTDTRGFSGQSPLAPPSWSK